MTVTIGSVTSNPVMFTIPVPLAVNVVAEGQVPLRPGIRHIAISPDGQRAYVTNPLLSTVSVLSLNPPGPLASITVGLKPAGLAVLPDGSTRTFTGKPSGIEGNPIKPSGESRGGPPGTEDQLL